MNDSPTPENNAAENRPVLEIIGDCQIELWSLGAAERHERAFARVGVHRDKESDRGKAVVAVRADYLLGADIVRALALQKNVLLVDQDTKQPVAAHCEPAAVEWIRETLNKQLINNNSGAIDQFTVVEPNELGELYDGALRKRAEPVVLPYNSTSIDELELRTFGAAYKGATDFVTKWIWPRPARTATRIAASIGLTPNTITTASLALVLLAMWLFYEGLFIAAIPIAWAMTFLDTVDGKLARVTLTSSPWGNVYDHGIDMIHPPFWWWAWFVGVQPMASASIAPLLEISLWVILAGYVIGRLLEGIFVLAFKIETHIWRPIDYFFRTITARRNPNLAILTVATLCSRPDIGFVAVAVWTVVSLLFHVVRIIQATWLRTRGVEVSSYLQP